LSGTDILLERETANDESAIVVAVHVASGQTVNKDELLFDIENSKATQEVLSPAAGIVVHELRLGVTVQFGVPIARISSADASNAAVVPPERSSIEPIRPSPSPPPPAQQPLGHQPLGHPLLGHDGRVVRVSRAASKVMAEHALTAADFTTSFVTRDDVLKRLGQFPQSADPRISGFDGGARPIDMVAARGDELSSHKRSEVEILARGAGATMLSVLGTSLGEISIARPEGDLLDGRITDLVIYEASRLMRKHRRLNAFYADGIIVEHEDVHAGLAIDGGGKLVVYGLLNSDRASLRDLSDRITEAVGHYVDNKLTAAEISRATFTVTDLSADELDFVFPLLPRGQSCIIGITHSTESGFRLFAGFDHRVTEGRDVGIFLNALRERLKSFATHHAIVPIVVQCLYCARTAGEAVANHSERGLLRIVDRHGRDAFCCASCWDGW
jgi:pyruvate/2-oxoglutarate dehydrogenase complex dihydrolipoamide acyltransferase (E2) component